MIPTQYAKSCMLPIFRKEASKLKLEDTPQSQTEYDNFMANCTAALTELQRAAFTSQFEDGIRIFEQIAPFTITPSTRKDMTNLLRIIYDSTKGEVNGHIYNEVADIITDGKTTKKDKLAAATVLDGLMNADKSENESKGLADKLIVSLVGNASDK